MDQYADIYENLSSNGLLNDRPLSIAFRKGEKVYDLVTFAPDETGKPVPSVKSMVIPGQADAFGLIFAKRPALNALLSLSPRYCAQVSNERTTLPACLDDMTQIVGLNARVANDSSPEALCKALRGRNACLIHSGGIIAAGRSLHEAFTAALVLEKGARTYELGKSIGGAKPVPMIAALLENFVYQRKYSKINLKEESSTRASGAAEAAHNTVDPVEQTVRIAIVECGKKLVERGLVQGTWGNISVRLDPEHMLVTPSGLDYLHLGPDDIVKMDLNTLEYDSARKPTSEKKLHQAVLQAFPEYNAVIHTHSENCSVYAATGADIPISDPAIKARFGGDVRCAPHALPGMAKLSKVTLKVLDGRCACLLQGHGVVCCGALLDEAFELCELLEVAAAIDKQK